MKNETVLYHRELGSLEQISKSLWGVQEKLNEQGLIEEAFHLEASVNGINTILKENNVKEIKVMRENKRNNETAFHPGLYISEIIEDKGISLEDLAKELQITPDGVRLLTDGYLSVTPTIAKRLAKATETSYELWLNLQLNYYYQIGMLKEDESWY